MADSSTVNAIPVFLYLMKRLPIYILLLFIVGACTQSADPDLIDQSELLTSSPLSSTFDAEGHRGARGLKPENTLPSFEIALDLEVTTLELDLHFTSDQVPVIWHDNVIKSNNCRRDPQATIDAPDPDSLIFQGDNLRISNLTFSQLQTYLCDRNPDEARFPEQDNLPTQLAGSNYHIISLSDLIDFVEAYSMDENKTESQRENASKVQFNIETKRKPNDPDAIGDNFDGVTAGAFELAIVSVVHDRNLVDRVILQSFDHRSLWAIQSLDEEIRLAALTSGGRPIPADFAEKGADIWSPNYADITTTLIMEAHAAGMLVIPWTINDLDKMQSLIDAGVDGIITDRPDLLMGLIRERMDNTP